MTATLKGTVSWSVANDNGEVHEELIPNTHYNEGSPYCLYSPQHIAQIAKDNYPVNHGTYAATHDDSVELFWNQRTEKRTIPLDPASNIAIFRSAPSYKNFHVFCASTGPSAASEELERASAFVTDDESSIDESTSEDDSVDSQENDLGRYWTRRHPDLPDSVFAPYERTGELTELQPDDEDVQDMTAQAQLLAWHYRLGHIPFEKIRQMAKRGDLPAALASCKVPRCAACHFGKQTRRSWRSKAPVNRNKIPPVTAPGSVVSIDQMISATPGLIAQMKGFITRKRYTVTTVFVDQFSGLSFVYLQKTTTAFETIEAKRAFERYAKLHGVVIKHYHADNGIFAAAEFVKALETEDGQTISYCGVNAHHQNGHAEKKIRDLQDLARTMLLHAQQRWPSAVTANLWPYAIRMANDVSNSSPGIKQGQEGVSPIELFSQVAVSPRLKHSHTFGSPVYVLDNRLQTEGKSIPK